VEGRGSWRDYYPITPLLRSPVTPLLLYPIAHCPLPIAYSLNLTQFGDFS
jgi:hypothetical protein